MKNITKIISTIALLTSSVSFAEIYQGNALCTGKVQIKDSRGEREERVFVNVVRGAALEDNQVIYVGPSRGSIGVVSLDEAVVQFVGPYIEDAQGTLTIGMLTTGHGSYHYQLNLSDYFSRTEGASSEYTLMYRESIDRTIVLTAKGQISCRGDIGNPV